jgi:hypothetical protein
VQLTLAVAWNVLGGGLFKTPEELKERASTLRGGQQPSEAQLAVAKVLAQVAEEVGAKGNLTGGTCIPSIPCACLSTGFASPRGKFQLTCSGPRMG